MHGDGLDPFIADERSIRLAMEEMYGGYCKDVLIYSDRCRKITWIDSADCETIVYASLSPKFIRGVES